MPMPSPAHMQSLPKRPVFRALPSAFACLDCFGQAQKEISNLFLPSASANSRISLRFLCAAEFLAGVIQLGGLMQIRGAFNDVARSLSWIIMSYEELAALAAAYERLERLESGLTQADHTRQQIQALNSADSKRSGWPSADILLKIPRGRAAALNAEIPVSFSLKPGSLAIITGPSGTGKLPRWCALAGFSESFTGCICGGSVLWMPQTPISQRRTV